METIGPEGYRNDCSGFVSACWGIPPSENGGWGGQSTVSLVGRGYMREIPKGDLKPGDAVGICGANTGGADGHIVLFEAWTSGGRYILREMAGGQRGPIRREVQYPYNMSGPWRAWRFVGVSESVNAASAGEEEREMHLVMVQGKPTIYLSDGITARAIKSEKELADVIYRARKQGLYTLREPSEGYVVVQGVRVASVGYLDLVGKVVA